MLLFGHSIDQGFSAIDCGMCLSIDSYSAAVHSASVVLICANSFEQIFRTTDIAKYREIGAFGDMSEMIVFLQISDRAALVIDFQS